MSFHLYVDDSGTREYAEDGQYSKTGGKSRYFVYGGVLIREQSLSTFISRLRELKRATFGTADVEIKCNWLRIADERRERYLEPYGISDVQLTQMTDAYYSLIGQAPVVLIAAVVDKLHMREKYGLSAWHPQTAAYDVLLQRAVQEVGTTDLQVTVDQIGGATAKKNEYKDLLLRHHDALASRGSSLLRSLSFKCLKCPAKFADSKHSDLVQVADLAAYNVHRQFRDFGDEWEKGGGPRQLPTYPYFQRIIGKFRTDANGRVQGYGIAKFPLLNRVPWRLTDDERKEE